MGQGIARTVVRVLRRRPALLCFPALSLSALGLILAVASMVPAGPLREIWERAQHNQSPTTAQFIGILPLLCLLSCAGTYFRAALLHSVHSLAAGSRPTIRASLGAAGRRLPTLVNWSLLAGSIGLLLRILESTAGLSSLFEMAGLSWSLLTFFALPVIVAESDGLVASLRRSLTLGRRQLGNWVAGGIRLFLTTTLVLMAGVAALILAVESDSLTVMVLSAGAVLALWLLTGLLTSTASGIYRMTLYRYAADQRAV